MARALSFLLFASLFTVLPFFSDLSKSPKIYVLLFGTLFLLTLVKELKIPRTYSHLALAFIAILLISSLGTRGIYSVLYLGAVFLFSLLIYNFYTLDLFCKLLSFMSVVTAALGLYEYFTYRIIGKSFEMVIPWVLPIDKSAQIGGIFGQPNIFAAFLLSTVPVLIMFYSKNGFKTKESLFGKIIYFPFFVVFFCFFLTFSRSGVVVYLMTALLLYFYRNHLKFIVGEKEVIFLLKVFFVSIFAFVAAMSVDYGFTFTSNRLSSSLGGTSIVSRIVMWCAGLMMFKDHFFFGIGLHNYRFLLSDYLMPVHELLGFVTYDELPFTDWAHNEFIQLAAEGGVLVVVCIVLSMYVIIRSFIYEKNSDVTYLCVMILVLVMHSMFSWTLRFPTMIFLFAALCGMLCRAANVDCYTMRLNMWIKCLPLLGLIIVGYFGYLEFQYAEVKINVKNGNIDIANFENLYQHDYLKYPLALKLLPRLLSLAQDKSDFDAIRRLKKYSKEIAENQGAHWQWFNYSTISLACNERAEARYAVNKALETAPLNEQYWAFLHYLNILDAADKTGRSVESFIRRSDDDFEFVDYLKNFKPINL